MNVVLEKMVGGGGGGGVEGGMEREGGVEVGIWCGVV